MRATILQLCGFFVAHAVSTHHNRVQGPVYFRRCFAMLSEALAD